MEDPQTLPPFCRSDVRIAESVFICGGAEGVGSAKRQKRNIRLRGVRIAILCYVLDLCYSVTQVDTTRKYS